VQGDTGRCRADRGWGGWGCPRCLYERREKFQYGVRPAGNGDASCAVFLLEDFADALSGDPRVEVYE